MPISNILENHNVSSAGSASFFRQRSNFQSLSTIETMYLLRHVPKNRYSPRV